MGGAGGDGFPAGEPVAAFEEAGFAGEGGFAFFHDEGPRAFGVVEFLFELVDLFFEGEAVGGDGGLEPVGVVCEVNLETADDEGDAALVASATGVGDLELELAAWLEGQGFGEDEGGGVGVKDFGLNGPAEVGVGVEEVVGVFEVGLVVDEDLLEGDGCGGAVGGCAGEFEVAQGEACFGEVACLGEIFG